MHEGHRERMRERIKNGGIDLLQPHEKLEFLLYYAIPRKDTNELAHRLIDKFGSLANVLAADYGDLINIKDMTSCAALLITSIPDFFSSYLSDLNAEKTRIYKRSDLLRQLYPLFTVNKTEKFYVLSLDAHNNVLNLAKLSSGLPAEVPVEPRHVVEEALRSKAVSVVISHNHPSGETKPSHSDIELTKTIAMALQLVKVKLLDHLIFSEFGYTSFVDEGLIEIIGKDVGNYLTEGLKY